MVFIDKGDSSSGVSNSSQQLTTFLELLESIALKLQSSGNPQDRVSGVDDGVEQLLTPEEEVLTNQGVALAAMDLLVLDGVERHTEASGVQSLYSSEKYVISAKFDDPSRVPIYTVRSTEMNADVLSFMADPADPNNPDKLIFLECEAEMSDDMKLEFIKGFVTSQRTQLEDREAFQELSGSEKIATILNVYGEDLAPEGAKAIYVASHLLNNEPDVQTAEDGSLRLVGEKFAFLKTNKGQIGIYEKSESGLLLICGMNEFGKVENLSMSHETSLQMNSIFGKIKGIEQRQKLSSQVLEVSQDRDDEAWLERFGVPSLER